MKKDLVHNLTESFEAHANRTDGGVEFWLARDLQHMLGYAEWRNLPISAISKAKTACEVSGREIPDHFVDVNKMVDLGSGSQPAIGRFRPHPDPQGQGLRHRDHDPQLTRIAHAKRVRDLAGTCLEQQGGSPGAARTRRPSPRPASVLHPMIATRQLALVLALAVLPGHGRACDETPTLEGVLSIAQCDPATTPEGCVPGSRAVYEALEALEIPNAFTIGVQASPWRMYDGEGRILTIEEVAVAVRAQRSDEDRRVYLAGSWTAARPDGSDATLAQRLSEALDAFPVEGSNGFLWLGPDGAMRTTRQAFSVWKTGPYSVAPGEDVLMALVPGAMAQFEDRFVQEGIAEGVVEAGIGHDVFMLCQERALAAFERAAELGSAIGAYNAGLMHAGYGDHDAATAWLEKARALGEAKATTALATLREVGE